MVSFYLFWFLLAWIIGTWWIIWTCQHREYQKYLFHLQYSISQLFCNMMFFFYTSHVLSHKQYFHCHTCHLIHHKLNETTKILKKCFKEISLLFLTVALRSKTDRNKWFDNMKYDEKGNHPKKKQPNNKQTN